MARTLTKRNIMTIYVRDDYIDTVNKFKNLVEKDLRFIELQTKKGDKLMSIAIMQLMLRYVTDRETELNDGATNANT